MVLGSRFLMGAAYRMLHTISLTYIANRESSYNRAYNTKDNVLDKDQAGEGSHVKKKAYILLTFFNISSSIIGPGIIITFVVNLFFFEVGPF